jgi:hypothetical protein
MTDLSGIPEIKIITGITEVNGRNQPLDPAQDQAK